MDLRKTLASVQSDIDEVNEWAESEYQKYFSTYFKKEVKLFDRLKSSENPITDEELEWILTDLPLELFSVTEQLSKLRTIQEVIKLNIKQKERDYILNGPEGMSETKKKEAASAMTAEDKLLITVYDNIAERVSRQMTFSRELIMGAKKIWDARRNDGIPLPELGIDSSEDTIPDYFSPNSNVKTVPC